MNMETKPRLHRDWIDHDAIEIVRTLQRKGFTTYLVGGCVRDLLVGVKPKDFDIVTTAKPQDVRKLIYQSYIIGKRFRLVLVRRHDRQYEVATFRKNFSAADYPSDEFPDGPPDGDNIFGSPEEDATRRDFTVNALCYDPMKNDLIDYITGLKDIESRSIKVIGPPIERMLEDPIRILRAIRLSHKLGFSLDVELRDAITKSCQSIPDSVLPRRREEILKIMRLQSPDMVFQECHDLGVLEYLCPTLNAIYKDEEKVQIFASYLRRSPSIICNTASPVELFGVIVLAYVRATSEDYTPINANRFLENETNLQLLRNELGLFKYEQSQVARALQVSQTLTKTDEFRRKGERRQMAILKNDSFPLALTMTQYDYLLPPEDIYFWHTAYDKAFPEIDRERREEKAARARKRPWKRKQSRNEKPESPNS